MFTGIIEKKAQILSLDPKDHAFLLTASTSFFDLKIGESISVDGVCLSVVESSNDRMQFFVSEQTISSSRFSNLKVGDWVNLERALTLQTRLSGHLVQGHVDGVAKLKSSIPESESHLLVFELSSELGKYCVPKGSICLNGVSLTIQAIQDTPEAVFVTVMIIPLTWEFTNLSELKVDNLVNVEIDWMAKYVERLCPRLIKP